MVWHVVTTSLSFYVVGRLHISGSCRPTRCAFHARRPLQSHASTSVGSHGPPGPGHSEPGATHRGSLCAAPGHSGLPVLNLLTLRHLFPPTGTRQALAQFPPPLPPDPLWCFPCGPGAWPAHPRMNRKQGAELSFQWPTHPDLSVFPYPSNNKT